MRPATNISHPASTAEANYDDLMASLFLLVTHHSLSQCDRSLMPIVDKLNQLCSHSEIDLYPNQRTVLLKMRQLWRTRLFKLQADAQESRVTH